MKFARISFPSREVAVQAYYGLARRGKVIGLANGQFIVPEPAVSWLRAEGLAYEVHAWLTQDCVAQAIRDEVSPNRGIDRGF